MIDPILIQIPIGVFGILSVVALSTNRIFLGCILASIGYPLWIWSAYQTEQWGAVVVLSIYMLAFLLGAIVRWPRKPPPKETDEHEWLRMGG